MEEQLEGLYMHNIVTPRQAVQQNLAQQQQLANSLQKAEEELQRQQQDLQEMENDVINLSAQLNKVGRDPVGSRDPPEKTTTKQNKTKKHTHKQTNKKPIKTCFDKQTIKRFFFKIPRIPRKERKGSMLAFSASRKMKNWD